MCEAEQAHVRWVDSQRSTIQRAAQQGKLSVALHDATPAAAAVWSKRRELLQRAGFTTELIASATGTMLVVRW